MKKNKKKPEEHGIISIVQSPDEEKSLKNDAQDTSDAPKEHGIISVVQAPDEAKTAKTDV